MNLNKQNILKTICCIIGFFYILFIIYAIKGTTVELYANKLINSISYLEVRINGSKFKSEKDTIAKLVDSIKEDDLIVEDLRKRNIISEYSLYSDLKDFRKSQKMITLEDENIWIDYSRHKIEFGEYKVPVSSKLCRFIKLRSYLKFNCNNNLVSFKIKDYKNQ
jgi:hypothetical protein